MVIRLKILKNNKISINNFHLQAPLFEKICFLDLPIIVGKLMVLNAVLASSSGYLIGSLAVHRLTERSVFPKLIFLASCLLISMEYLEGLVCFPRSCSGDHLQKIDESHFYKLLNHGDDFQRLLSLQGLKENTNKKRTCLKSPDDSGD